VLGRAEVRGTILASFERVCYLSVYNGVERDAGDGPGARANAGALVALAWDGVEDGPLNLLLERAPGRELPAGTPFGVADGQLVFATPEVLPVDLAGALTWEPRPDWSWLSHRREHMRRRATGLAGLLETPGLPQPFGRPDEEQVAQAASGEMLLSCQARDGAGMEAAAGRLCGLGPGLTPAGDDWLAGLLLALWLDEPASRRARLLRRAAHSVAERRTTRISRAFMECAVVGEADAAWQRLLAALAEDRSSVGRGAANKVLRTTTRLLRACECVGRQSMPGPRSDGRSGLRLAAYVINHVSPRPGCRESSSEQRRGAWQRSESRGDGWAVAYAKYAETGDIGSAAAPLRDDGECQSRTQIEAAARAVLAHGATSGAAMLAGFLAGLNLPQETSDGPGDADQGL
jgi:hypothetical protein